MLRRGNFRYNRKATGGASNRWGTKTLGPGPDGETVNYDSALEARYATLLAWRVKAGDIRSWRRQIAFPLPPKEIKTPEARRRITIDFEETLNDGSIALVEVKGYPDRAFPVRWAWFRREYSHLEARIERGPIKLPF